MSEEKSGNEQFYLSSYWRNISDASRNNFNLGASKNIGQN
jgi:hypothetical protein